LFFQGPDADKWLETGIAIYRRELPEQILADGGHFELSPMYHSIILEDILDLINLGNRFQNQLLQELPLPEIAGRMLSWLSGMCHQDGQISFFNDAATGIAPHPFWLFNYAKSLGVHYAKASSNVYFGESGYFRLSANKIMIIADIGQVGPDYQPGHAHADTLSFEMSYDGQRVLVNTGTSCYGSGSERIYQRSTPAHNAVTVDGLNSSEVWDGHRVARRAGILSRSFSSRNACAAHNGFARVIPDCIHSRCWKLSDNQVEITDRINGYGEHRISIYWHFHPDIKVDCLNKHRFTLSVNNVIKGHMICSEDYTSYIYSGYYAPEFGKMIMNSTVLLEKKCQFPTITKTVFEFVQ
jgi:uncharacterized heparinase superfamily protein